MRMKSVVRAYRKSLIFLVMSPGLVFASYLGYVYETGNFHAVVAEEAYRSRQLDEAEFRYYLQTYQIRSILNLRGTNQGSEWYQAERLVAEQLNVKHFDYGISANRDVPEADVDAILTIIREAPKPILIHCKSGADRTGLVAALYQYSWGGRNAEEASGQLSMLYGHLPFIWNSTAAMDRTYWRYVSTHSAK
jgi:protein tyrosine/serine phosphatase